MRSNHCLQSQSVAAQLGIKVSDEDLKVVIRDVIKDVLQLIIEIVLESVFRIVRWCIDLHNGLLGVSKSKTSCDDAVVNRFPNNECAHGFFAQYKPHSMLMSIFMTQVQDRLAIADNSATLYPPHFIDSKDV